MSSLHNPQIDPIIKYGQNDSGVLLLHGFTGTPDSMRHIANHLHQAGYSVLAPLLEGHGTTPENLAETNWQDWYYSASESFKNLKKENKKVFVAGLSLGALLALKLAMDHPDEISAISCYATPLHLQSWAEMVLPVTNYPPFNYLWKFQKKWKIDIKDPIAKRNFWNYDRMPLSCVRSITELQKNISDYLHKIECPTLLMHSRHDSTAPYHSMLEVAEKISSEITEMITLENSFHVITVDYDKDLVAKKTKDFFNRFREIRENS